MTCPPIEWDDLYANGVARDVGVMIDGVSVSFSGSSSPFGHKLLRAAFASPAPEGDRLAYLRHVRDLLVGLTDYTQAADSPFTAEQRQAWAAYRQALRDLPQTYAGEGPIPWPEVPG